MGPGSGLPASVTPAPLSKPHGTSCSLLSASVVLCGQGALGLRREGSPPLCEYRDGSGWESHPPSPGKCRLTDLCAHQGGQSLPSRETPLPPKALVACASSSSSCRDVRYPMVLPRAPPYGLNGRPEGGHLTQAGSISSLPWHELQTVQGPEVLAASICQGLLTGALDGHIPGGQQDSKRAERGRQHTVPVQVPQLVPCPASVGRFSLKELGLTFSSKAEKTRKTQALFSGLPPGQLNNRELKAAFHQRRPQQVGQAAPASAWPGQSSQKHQDLR